MARNGKNGQKTPPRRVRPELPRAEPVRSWSTLFGSGPSAGSPPASGGGDKVPRGVELGYRVIDDYIKQGTAIASAFANPARGQSPSPRDLPQMTERMLKYASDFTSLWFDAMGLMMGNANGQRNGAAPTPVSADPSASRSDVASGGAAGRSRYVLEVRSERPAEVIVALDEPLPEKLKVEPLRARPKGRAIVDASIKPPPEHGGPMRVRVHVPPKLRPGRYSGAVLDAATGQPKGRLTVLLG